MMVNLPVTSKMALGLDPPLMLQCTISLCKVRPNRAGAAACSSLCPASLWDICWHPNLERQRWGVHKSRGNELQFAPHCEDLSSLCNTDSIHTPVDPQGTGVLALCFSSISWKSWSDLCEDIAQPKPWILYALHPAHQPPQNLKVAKVILELLWMDLLTLDLEFLPWMGAVDPSRLRLFPVLRHEAAPWSFGKAWRATGPATCWFEPAHKQRSQQCRLQNAHWSCRQSSQICPSLRSRLLLQMTCGNASAKLTHAWLPVQPRKGEAHRANPKTWLTQIRESEWLRSLGEKPLQGKFRCQNRVRGVLPIDGVPQGIAKKYPRKELPSDSQSDSSMM